jgi:hypothetical protein
MSKRHRCSECRRFFIPSPTARHTQKTCSPECRKKRRRKLTKRRRARELEEYRADERERQREHRDKHRKNDQRQEQRPGLSRAGLATPEPILRAEIIETVDKELALSRARLMRRIGLLYGREAQKLRQVETENLAGNAPASAGNATVLQD